jgi:hypothetical protein
MVDMFTHMDTPMAMKNTQNRHTKSILMRITTTTNTSMRSMIIMITVIRKVDRHYVIVLSRAPMEHPLPTGASPVQYQ